MNSVDRILHPNYAISRKKTLFAEKPPLLNTFPFLGPLHSPHLEVFLSAKQVPNSTPISLLSHHQITSPKVTYFPPSFILSPSFFSFPFLVDVSLTCHFPTHLSQILFQFAPFTVVDFHLDAIRHPRAVPRGRWRWRWRGRRRRRGMNE